MSVDGEKTFEAGIFLVDKPLDVTSFGVVSRLRRILNKKKVGHAGTLDPLATGLLIVCAGRQATKLISSFMDGEKEYRATLKLGIETETQDREGTITRQQSVGTLPADVIERCLAGFRGEQMQVPPVYSALKHKGKPLYYYARKGSPVTKEARPVNILELERIDGDHDVGGDVDTIDIRVVCGKGTYIRTLAADIGMALGCGAHLQQLRRTKSGSFSVDSALRWQELTAEDAYNHCMSRVITVEEVCKLLQ